MLDLSIHIHCTCRSQVASCLKTGPLSLLSRSNEAEYSTLEFPPWVFFPFSLALQQFFKAQINLLSLPFSIKEGEGDWFTLVKLRDEHKWYSALTGVALQVATETLNKVITTPQSAHAVRKH